MDIVQIRRQLILILFLLFSQATLADLNTGLLAYWNFNDCTATDTSGNGKNGELKNNTSCVDGVSNKAIHLQGNGYMEDSGGHVILPTFNFSEMQNYSVCLWVNEQGMTAYDGEAYISFGDHQDGMLVIGHLFESLVISSGRTFQGGGVQVAYDSNDNNKFIHYCLTYKNTHLRAFKNGKLLGAAIETISAINNNHAALGRHWWYQGSATSTRFIGDIDAVRIYNRTLSDSEVMEIYQAKEQFTINATPLVSLNDINKDAAPEIAVITYNPTLKKTTATVKNAQTGALVEQIQFEGQFVPTKANLLGAAIETISAINNNHAALGRHWWYQGSATSTRFIGDIDAVRIYNRTLSDSEVMEIYQAKEQFTINATPLVSLNDINKDAAPEIAVITYNPTLKKTTATVKNAQTGALVEQIQFEGQFVPTKANVLPDLNGNGAPEIAVLGVRSSDQAVQVEVRDSLSGVKLSAVPFDSIFTPLDLGVVRDISGKGTAGLAVLQQSATELRAQLKNALSGVEIGNINFSAGYKGIDLIVLGDLNGNRTKEIAVLADNKTATAADTVEIRDSKTGALIRTISYGTGKDLQQLINLPDLNNSGGAELAVLRANTARVLVKDAKTGLPVNTLDYAVSQPFRLATVADSNSQTNLAMLGVRAATGQPRADLHDPLSDTFINKVLYDSYGTTVGFIAIPDINGNGVAELVRLREQPGPQKLFAEVRDGRTGVLIQGMYF